MPWQTRFFERLKRSRYFRDSSTNTLGLLAAAVFPVAVTPILSRLYAPEEFGIFGLFIAVTTTISTVGAGRYEVAIVIPERKIEALETAYAALIVSGAVALALCAFVLFLGPWSASLLGLPLTMVLFAPLAIFVTVQFQILTNCAIRERLFSKMSLARVIAALCSALLMVGTGLLGFGAWGLIVGAVAGQFIGVLILLVAARRSYLDVLPEASRGGAVRQLARFSDYPKYAVGSDLANTLALRLPVLVFAGAFGGAAVGYLTMFQRLWAGSSILGRGIGETFRQKAARDYASQGNFRRTYVVTFWVMLAMILPVWVVLVLWAPWIFAVVLGDQWSEAGIYAQILATLVCIQFLASPLGWTVYIVERLRYNMVWQWALLGIYAAALYVGVIHFEDERQTLLLFSAVGSGMYLVYLVISYQLAKGHPAPLTERGE